MMSDAPQVTAATILNGDGHSDRYHTQVGVGGVEWVSLQLATLDECLDGTDARTCKSIHSKRAELISKRQNENMRSAVGTK
jgi:hypothetical protein